MPEGAALGGVAGATSDLANGVSACFEDCSSLKFFKVCVLNRKPSWRNIITWQTENMKSSSGRSPPPLLPCPASSGEGGGGAARCRNTILLSPSRWYLTAPARVLAEPPGEKTGASRIRSARRAALPAHPTKPTTTTPPSWDGEAAASAPEEEVEGAGVRDRTRTAEEGVA